MLCPSHPNRVHAFSTEKVFANRNLAIVILIVKLYMKYFMGHPLTVVVCVLRTNHYL